jgi:hypothetical protein
MTSKFIKKYDKVAYGRPRNIKGAGKVINVGSNVGTKIIQFVYLRPQRVGYKLSKKL